MIDLHYWTTPNGHKITMFLEETGLKYKIFPVNIGKGDQFKPEFLAIAPNNRIPAMVDHEPKGGGKPISIFESGAMLLYLAEKTGKFLPSDIYGRYDAIQWTFWQMGGLGPMAGQNHHFSNYAQDKIKYAIDRYVNETNRLYGVLNKRLADREFIAGDYSIADMASYPWVVPYKNVQEPEPEHRRLPASQALARDHSRAAGDAARLRQGQGGQPEFRPAGDPHRGRAQAVVRADRGGGEVALIAALRWRYHKSIHRHCERSEAIQRVTTQRMDCFVAYAPRNDGDDPGGGFRHDLKTVRTGRHRRNASVQPVLLADADGAGA